METCAHVLKPRPHLAFVGGAEVLKRLIMVSLWGALLTVAILRACSATLQYDPEPNPSSVVEVGQARFTVLTSHLIRMEWGSTIDAATFTFINRNLPTPEFNTSKDGDWTVIQTAAVKVVFFLFFVYSTSCT